MKPDETSGTRQSRPGSVWSGSSFPSGRALGGVPSAASGYPPLLPQPTPRPMSMYGFPSQYATPSVAQSSATAVGQFSHQRHSSYSSVPAGPLFTLPPSMPPHYQYAPQPQGVMPLSQSYGSSLFPRTIPQQQDSTPANPGYYDTSSLQLPPILPVPQGPQTDPTTLQQQSQYPPPVTGVEQTTGQLRPPIISRPSHERDPKRPRMDIGDVLHPRHD